MKHLIPTFALLIGSLFAPVAVSAQTPIVCSGPSGLVYTISPGQFPYSPVQCSDENVGNFPAATSGQCLVVNAYLALVFGACPLAQGGIFTQPVFFDEGLSGDGGATLVYPSNLNADGLNTCTITAGTTCSTPPNNVFTTSTNGCLAQVTAPLAPLPGGIGQVTINQTGLPTSVIVTYTTSTTTTATFTFNIFCY
jgi:hypothetical protein